MTQKYMSQKPVEAVPVPGEAQLATLVQPLLKLLQKTSETFPKYYPSQHTELAWLEHQENAGTGRTFGYTDRRQVMVQQYEEKYHGDDPFGIDLEGETYEEAQSLHIAVKKLQCASNDPKNWQDPMIWGLFRCGGLNQTDCQGKLCAPSNNEELPDADVTHWKLQCDKCQRKHDMVWSDFEGLIGITFKRILGEELFDKWWESSLNKYAQCQKTEMPYILDAAEAKFSGNDANETQVENPSDADEKSEEPEVHVHAFGTGTQTDYPTIPSVEVIPTDVFRDRTCEWEIDGLVLNAPPALSSQAQDDTVGALAETITRGKTRRCYTEAEEPVQAQQGTSIASDLEDS